MALDPILDSAESIPEGLTDHYSQRGRREVCPECQRKLWDGTFGHKRIEERVVERKVRRSRGSRSD